MTPEEIAEIRQDSKTICPTNIAAVSWQAHARELLEHIDLQADEIKRLEADNQNLSTLNAALMGDGNDLRGRILRLEDALVEERAKQNSNLVRKKQNAQQADYVARLEAAYLAEARENIQATKEFLQEQQTPEEYQAEIDRLARAALARVRGDE